MLSGGARERGNTPEQLQQALRTELADVLCQVLLLARHHDESTCRLRSRRSGFVETLTGCSDRPRTRIASRFARGLAMSGTGTRQRHPSIGGRARYRPITGHQSVSDPPMPHFDPRGAWRWASKSSSDTIRRSRYGAVGLLNIVNLLVGGRSLVMVRLGLPW